MKAPENFIKSVPFDHDVIIVGAGVAGASASIMFSRLGLNVLLLDKKLSSEDYKANCTTFIQPSALPVIRKLGIKEQLDDAGAVQNSALFWTEYGWIKDTIERDEAYRHGYSVQRKKLDPLLLRKAGEGETVTIKLGSTLESLIENDAGDFVGVRYISQDGSRHEATSQLVVLADGRNSKGAQLAGVPTVKRENNRFSYFAYYRNMPLKSGRTAQFWHKHRDMGFAYPFDDGLTMLCCFVTQDQHDEWSKDKFAALEDFFKDLPGAPDQSHAERATKMFGMRRLNDYKRPSVHRNLALIGDACMSCDPMSGVGCGFAFQAADWLVESVGEALVQRRSLAPALAEYKRVHRARLAGHEYFIQDNSTGRGMNFLEKMISRAAVADAKVAHRLHMFVGRIISWKAFLTPAMLVRIMLSNVTYLRSKERLQNYEPV